VIIGTIQGDFVEMLHPAPESDGPSLLYEPPILLSLTAANCRNFYCPTSVFLTCVTGEEKYLRTKRAYRYSVRKTWSAKRFSPASRRARALELVLLTVSAQQEDAKQ
jgi:hypothetical protein